jgi:hypothetical protein
MLLTLISNLEQIGRPRTEANCSGDSDPEFGDAVLCDDRQVRLVRLTMFRTEDFVCKQKYGFRIGLDTSDRIRMCEVSRERAENRSEVGV